MPMYENLYVKQFVFCTVMNPVDLLFPGDRMGKDTITTEKSRSL
ncbi:MAG: hypothetical protein ACLTT1_01110 [[Clostridium] scindens]